jgi:hypothetical protein
MNEKSINADTPPRSHDPEYSWRYRCPEGHVTVEEFQTDGFYCNTCRQKYPGDPIDAKENDE